MKSVAVPLLLAVVLLALVPPAAAQPSLRPQAGTEPTHLQVLMPANITVGLDAAIDAVLHDAVTGTPVPRENVTFAYQTKFGWLSLGTVATTSLGRAIMDYVPRESGNITIRAVFPGDSVYAASNASLAVDVLPAGLGPAPALLPMDRVIVLVILAVVGGVWATYAFVAFLILGIRADRPEEESSSAPKEKKSMADEEPAPQRAPGSANAGNRTVAIIAAVALVLGGLAVTLAGISAFTPRAAGATYTPGNVKFSVAVVPDIRGSGWDSFLPNALVVHVGDSVQITVYNADTMMHGFAIDAFAVNKDLPPATANATGAITPSTTVITFTASQTGSFTFYCTQPCGDGHLSMTGTLTVFPD